MNREPFSNADHALLRFDSPENWMINTGMIILESRLTVDDLISVLQGSLLSLYRFRQRVVRPNLLGGKAYWEDDHSFNLKRHISTICTPLPANPKLLEEIISSLMSVGLDPSLPLWQIYLVEKYGNGSAVLMRLHHSLADGASLVNVLLSMTQDQPGFLSNDERQPKLTQPDRLNGRRNGKEPGTMQVLGKFAQTGIKILGDVEALGDAIRLGSSTASAIKTLVLNPSEPENNFRGSVGKSKRATWSPAISLDRVRVIGKTYGSTINDVLLCAVTGALRQYILQLDGNRNPPKIHSLVPVDMRREYRLAQVRSLTGANLDTQLGNQVGATLLSLPLDVDDPLERLKVIHQSMDVLKASGEALATFGLIEFLGAVPAEIQDLATRFWLSKSSVVMTNVVGPNKQLYIGSAAIDTVMGWVPTFGPLGLGISFFSYNGKIWIGVATDEGLIPDPEKIIESFLEEIHKLDQSINQKLIND